MLFLLVHSPLLGPGSWGPVAGALGDRGHIADNPDIRVFGPAGVLRECQVAKAVDGVRPKGRERRVVVGHSGAGPLLPSIGNRVDGGADGYVFVDAALPHPGRSRMEALPGTFARHLRGLAVDGVLPPWTEWFAGDTIADLVPDPEVRSRLASETPRLPMRMFEEALPVVPGWPDAPCAFLRLSEAYAGEAELATDMGWLTAEMRGHHLSILSHPRRVADAVVSLAARLAQ